VAGEGRRDSLQRLPGDAPRPYLQDRVYQGGLRANGPLLSARLGKIKEIERNLGVRLVESEVGGLGGGQTRLTPEGEQLLARYRAFRAAAEADIRRDFAEAFGRKG